MPTHTRKGSPTPGPVSPAVNQPVGRRPQPLPEGEAISQSQVKSIAEDKAIHTQPVPAAPAAEEILPDPDSFQAAGTTEPIPFPGSGKEPAASADSRPGKALNRRISRRQTPDRRWIPFLPGQARPRNWKSSCHRPPCKNWKIPSLTPHLFPIPVLPLWKRSKSICLWKMLSTCA